MHIFLREWIVFKNFERNASAIKLTTFKYQSFSFSAHVIIFPGIRDRRHNTWHLSSEPEMWHVLLLADALLQSLGRRYRDSLCSILRCSCQRPEMLSALKSLCLTEPVECSRLLSCSYIIFTLQWHHNERDDALNHGRLDYLLKILFRRRSKKTLNLRITGLCEENPPVTASQMAINVENVSISWRHNVLQLLFECQGSFLPKCYNWH